MRSIIWTIISQVSLIAESGVMIAIIGQLYGGIILVHGASAKERSPTCLKAEISKAVGGSDSVISNIFLRRYRLSKKVRIEHPTAVLGSSIHDTAVTTGGRT